MYTYQESKTSSNEFGDILGKDEMEVLHKHFTRFSTFARDDASITNMNGNLNTNKASYESFFFKDEVTLHKS